MINCKIVELLTTSIPVNKEKFDEKCRIGCSKVYGKKWSCPPYSLKFDPYSYQTAHIVILWKNNIRPDNRFIDVRAINSTLRAKLYKLLKEFPNWKVLGSGSCKLCAKCEHPNPCKRPNQMIYSCESTGIDVALLCESLGHKLYWYNKSQHYDYGTVVGLILDSQRAIIEEKLTRILGHSFSISMQKFGSIRYKTVHEMVLMPDGLYHFKCIHSHCPGYNNGICISGIINNNVDIKWCFCG